MPDIRPPDAGGDRRLTPRRVLIVGAGLIGTSVALALREEGVDVAINDREPGRSALAIQLGAGRLPTPSERFDVAIAAVPPDHVAAVLLELQRANVASTYTDVASTKSYPQLEAEALGVDPSSYIGGHPLAGRERSGPANARADLFVGRAWVLTPARQARADCVEMATRLVRATGALPVTMTANDHDRAVAVVSHLPHVLSTVLATQLTRAQPEVVAVAGTGLQDLTRLAAGDPALWTEILRANAEHVAVALEGFSVDLERAVRLLRSISRGDEAAAAELHQVLADGVAGRNRLPGKRGEAATGFETVAIAVRDAPGELARLLGDAATAEINIEDLRVDHEPGRPLGTAELVVREESVADLVVKLRAQGWTIVH